MYERKTINDKFVYYKYDNHYILINSSNGAWLVYDTQSELNNAINLILNFSNENTGNKTSYHKFLKEIQPYKNPTLHLYLTNKCNLRCEHCYMRAESNLEEELTFDEVVKLITDFKNNGGEKIIFTGGEVSLVENFPIIIKHSKKIGLETLVLSNGTAWSKQQIEEVAKYADCVQISIDGFDEESNAKIRGAGFFQKSLDCIDKFLDSGTEVLATVTPTYGVENQIEEYAEFGKSLVEKYKGKKFYIVFNKEGLSTGRNIVADLKKNKIYKKAVLKILEKIYPGYELGCFEQDHLEALQNCGYGKISVDSNGQYAFCTNIKDIPTFGNVRTDSIEKIMNIANEIGKKTCVDYLEVCNECDFRYICGGECRMDYYSNGRNISNVEKMPTLKLLINCDNDKIENFLKMIVMSYKKKS